MPNTDLKPSKISAVVAMIMKQNFHELQRETARKHPSAVLESAAEIEGFGELAYAIAESYAALVGDRLHSPDHPLEQIKDDAHLFIRMMNECGYDFDLEAARRVIGRLTDELRLQAADQGQTLTEYLSRLVTASIKAAEECGSLRIEEFVLLTDAYDVLLRHAFTREQYLNGKLALLDHAFNKGLAVGTSQIDSEIARTSQELGIPEAVIRAEWRQYVVSSHVEEEARELFEPFRQFYLQEADRIYGA